MQQHKVDETRTLIGVMASVTYMRSRRQPYSVWFRNEFKSKHRTKKEALQAAAHYVESYCDDRGGIAL